MCPFVTPEGSTQGSKLRSEENLIPGLGASSEAAPTGGIDPAYTIAVGDLYVHDDGGRAPISFRHRYYLRIGGHIWWTINSRALRRTALSLSENNTRA